MSMYCHQYLKLGFFSFLPVMKDDSRQRYLADESKFQKLFFLIGLNKPLKTFFQFAEVCFKPDQKVRQKQLPHRLKSDLVNSCSPCCSLCSRARALQFVDLGYHSLSTQLVIQSLKCADLVPLRNSSMCEDLHVMECVLIPWYHPFQFHEQRKNWKGGCKCFAQQQGRSSTSP